MKKRKLGRKLLSFLLTLAMAVGLVPGMGMTAQAAGEKAYAAYDVTTETNKTKSGNDLTALQVTFNGKKWYIIEDNSSSATSGTVTLLSADTSFGTKTFGDEENYSNKYSTSQVKAYLDSMTGTNGAFADVADAIETVNLTTYKYNSTEVYETVNGVKLYLLSTEEAKSLPENVRKAEFTGGTCSYSEWWLRSPGYDYDMAALVYGADGTGDMAEYVHGGDVIDFGNNVRYDAWGVRPALKLNLESVIFSSETNTFTVGSVASEPENIIISPASGDIAEALAAAEEGKTVGDITINLTEGVTYTISNTIVAPASLTINGNGAIIDAGNLNAPMIALANIENPTQWTELNIAVSGLYVNGLKKQMFYSACKNYFCKTFTVDNCVVEVAADVITFDFTKGSVAESFVISNSTFYAPAATTKSFYSSQAGQKLTEARDDGEQTFKLTNDTFYNLAPTKNFFTHRQNSQRWQIYEAKGNVFVNCGKSGQVIVGLNGGAASTKPTWDIDGNLFNYDGADTSAIETTGDNNEPVKNSIAGVVTFTDAESGNFNGMVKISGGGTLPEKLGDPRFTLSSHAHSFIYSAEGVTITATCSADGCTLLPSSEGGTDHVATLTIVKPTMETYGQTGDGISEAATLTGLEDFNSATGKTVAVTDIRYVGIDGTTYAESATAPTNAGKYTAKITVEGKNAFVNYEIAKVNPTAPTGLTATYGQTLADVTLPDGWTWADSTQSVGSVISPAATFKANFAGNDNYNAASDVDVTVTVSKAANPAIVAGTATVTKGGNTVDLAGNVTLNGATGEVAYAIDGEANGCTLSGSMLTSGDNAGSVTVNVSVAADNNYNGLAATPITVTISDKGTQTITASDVTATYGDTDKSVSGTTTGDGAISYSVKSGDAVTVDENTGALTIVKAGSAVITVTAAETATYALATKDVNVTVNTKAMTVSAENVNVTVDGQPHGITVNVTDPASAATVKYGTEVGTYNLDASPTQTEAGELTVYYQVTADNYTTYTGSAKVTVSDKSTQTIDASDVTATYGDTDKKVEATTDGNGAISYAVKEGSADYIDVDSTTGALTIKKVGTATVIVTAAETATYAQATKEVTVTINKANAVAATVTANNRTYDGTEKPLVTVTGEATGGTMQYALGMKDAATQPYTTSIPTATDAGTYYVWYKVVGDINDNDSKAVCITVVIKPQSLTDASVTVDTKDKTVTVKNDRAIVPAEAYHVIYFAYKKIEGGESLKRVGTDFPEEYGEYIAAVVANENSGYTGENRSEPFAIGTSGSVSFNQDENSDETVQTAVKNVESSNLSDFAEELAEEGKFVKVELEITPVKAEKVDQTSVNGTKQIAEGLFVGFDADQVATEYFEIDIKKYVNNEDAGIISDTKNPLEITLTYDNTKMFDPVVVRTHNGETKAFDKLSARPAKADYKDATYYVGDGVIYIYSQYFSDYAIIYTTVKTYNVDIVTGTGDKISKTVAEGSKAGLPTGLLKSGYTFSGWYSDEACTKVWKEDDAVTADITIYAKWTKDPAPTQVPTTVPTSAPTPVPTSAPVTTPTATPTPTVAPTVTPTPVKDSITAEEAARGAIKLNAGLKVYPKNSDVVVKWGKVENADRYVIYAAYCKKGRKCAKIATLDGDVNSYKFSELNGKPINTRKNIKLYVVAYRKVNGKYKKITSSITAHIVGSGSKKYSNVKGIKVESTKITLSLDDNTAAPSSYTLNPVAVLKDSSKKMLLHTAEFRYASSKSSVATVGKDGTITAKGKGTCYVYVYAQNGYAKKIKVTVK